MTKVDFSVRFAHALALKKSPQIKIDNSLGGCVSIASHLLRSSSHSFLLGKNEKDEQEIIQSSLEFSKLWKEKFSASQQAAVKELNAYLDSKTFIATNYFSLADVVVYSLLYSVPFSPLDRLENSNVIRYFDLVQHTVKSFVSFDDIEITEFNLDVPLVEKVVEKAEKPSKGTPTTEKGSKTSDKKDESKKKEEPKKSDAKVIDPSKLDIRVGKILNVEKHPEADALYVETIDLGEATGPRTVVSGLVKYMEASALMDKFVVLLCNLKPAKMRGIESAAMVLCANSADGSAVELLTPPAGSKIGDRVSFEGFAGEPEALLKPKQKVWESLQPNLHINNGLQAVFVNPETKKEALMKTSAGPITSKTIKGNIK